MNRKEREKESERERGRGGVGVGGGGGRLAQLVKIEAALYAWSGKC